MSKTLHLLCIMTLLPVLIISGCSDDEDFDDVKVSSHGSSASHNTGQNCMNCHRSGGSGKGVFQAAGSVYQLDSATPYPNTTVYLYTGPDSTGNLVAVLEVDAKGNFYTTNAIDWGSQGLYPVVESNVGTRSMTDPTSNGACNQCHNGSNQPGRIFVD